MNSRKMLKNDNVNNQDYYNQKNYLPLLPSLGRGFFSGLSTYQ